MTHVITQSCCNDATCVVACPANCIHPTPDEPDYTRTEMLYIDPRSCVDCGACIQACPVDAIVPHDELTPYTARYAELNALYFAHNPTVTGRPQTEIGISQLVAQRQNPPEPPRTAPPAAPRVAIVGSGPSACYAAEELFARRPDTEVHMFECLPTPWGLVRAGVAPDHPDTKDVIRSFERTATRPGFHLHLNVEVGTDITHEELLSHHDAVIYAVGAHGNRRLNIPGEHLPGSHSATDFVAWYNGHPRAADYTFDLDTERAVVIGNGNVALDVARILLTDVDTLARTDAADHALAALAESRIEEVVVLGRRGPVQAAYTTPELLALGHLDGIDVAVDPAEAQLDPHTTVWFRDHPDPTAQFKASITAEYATRVGRHRRRITLRYLGSPLEIVGTDRVRGLRIVRNELIATRDGRLEATPTGQRWELECGLVLRSVGYRGEPITGVPFDESRGLIPNRAGRVVDPVAASPITGAYTTGWIKRGPSGVIGTNKKCAQETISGLLEDYDAGRLPEPAHDAEAMETLLHRRRPLALDYQDWQAIDRRERAAADGSPRPRVKLVDIDEMIAVAERSRNQRQLCRVARKK
ncbi:FAD-dependent oxidoreductase [Nocardia carnea]|uniref:FAD-dependent oxidoreductase n=1 Tax=Nocardia carnea TaxID=37328 RepID=UPI0024545047|nr:FAD-dependent oxidoreductase [Nocardia carnea]